MLDDDATPTFTITRDRDQKPLSPVGPVDPVGPVSTPLPNITDVGKIIEWSRPWNDTSINNSPQRELAYDIIGTTLKNYFQHFSRTFVRIKKTGGMFKKKVCVYSGVISDIDKELNNFPLTEHTISINDEVLTTRINQLNKDLRMVDLKENSADILPDLYENYSIEKTVGLTLNWKYGLGWMYGSAPSYKYELVLIVPLNAQRNVLTDYAIVQTASAQSVFKSIDVELETRSSLNGPKLGKFTSLPPGWLVPRPITDK